MPAMVACMNKWLLYAFAVMKRREAFQVNHVWRSQAWPPPRRLPEGFGASGEEPRPTGVLSRSCASALVAIPLGPFRSLGIRPYEAR